MIKLTPEQENLFLKLKEELGSTLDKRVDDHLEKDRNLIKETISTVVQVFKWTVGIAAVLVAVLGIKTYLDIGNKIESIIKEHIKENSEVLSKYDQTATPLYDKALIESYSIQLKKSIADHINIEPNDYNRILEIIEDKETDESDFMSCINILESANTSEFIKSEPLEKMLLSVLLNRDKKYSWIDEQESKQIALINFFSSRRNVGCENYCKEVLNGNNKLLKIAAINYLKKINSPDIIQFAEKVYSKEQDDDIKIEFLKAVAYTKYNSSLLIEYFKNQNINDLSLGEIVSSIDILNQILVGIQERGQNNWEFERNKKENDYLDSAALFISQYFIRLETKVDLCIVNGFMNDNVISLGVRSKGNSSFSYSIPFNFLLFYNSLIPNKILHTNNLSDFQKHVDFLTIVDDESDFYNVSVNFEDNQSSVIYENGKITKDLIQGNGWLKMYNKKLYFKFWDKAGNFKSL